jgi:hypothetical protein
VNLLPYLLRISQRPEEMIQETLSAAMAKICPVLASFMTDVETKVGYSHVIKWAGFWAVYLECLLHK